MYESVLYIDPQAAKPAAFCPVCGGDGYTNGDYGEKRVFIGGKEI